MVPIYLLWQFPKAVLILIRSPMPLGLKNFRQTTEIHNVKSCCEVTRNRWLICGFLRMLQAWFKIFHLPSKIFLHNETHQQHPPIFFLVKCHTNYQFTICESTSDLFRGGSSGPCFRKDLSLSGIGPAQVKEISMTESGRLKIYFDALTRGGLGEDSDSLLFLCQEWLNSRHFFFHLIDPKSLVEWIFASWLNLSFFSILQMFVWFLRFLVAGSSNFQMDFCQQIPPKSSSYKFLHPKKLQDGTMALRDMSWILLEMPCGSWIISPLGLMCYRTFRPWLWSCVFFFFFFGCVGTFGVVNKLQ